MKYIKLSEGLSMISHDLYQSTIKDRYKELSKEEFLKLLEENCKNFSLDNDQLWRSQDSKNAYELFTPNNRNVGVLAFKDYFNSIEHDSEYPVIRKKSLIGGTNKEVLKTLVGSEMYLVIPYDNSEIVFCPILDLWAMSDNRRGKSELVNKEPVNKNHFVKASYTNNFKIPYNNIQRIKIANNLRGDIYQLGCEFFTSSNCLMIHEDEIENFFGKK